MLQEVAQMPDTDAATRARDSSDDSTKWQPPELLTAATSQLNRSQPSCSRDLLLCES